MESDRTGGDGTEQDAALKRVLWRCRRGTRELELILSTFVRSRYASLDQDQRDQFEALLQVQDPVVTDWLCYDVAPDSELAAIVSLILSHKEGDDGRHQPGNDFTGQDNR